jgi:hypothetical protein
MTTEHKPHSVPIITGGSERYVLLRDYRALIEQFDTAIETLRRVYRETEWTEADFADEGLAWQINGVLKAASIPASVPKTWKTEPECDGTRYCEATEHIHGCFAERSPASRSES